MRVALPAFLSLALLFIAGCGSESPSGGAAAEDAARVDSASVAGMTPLVDAEQFDLGDYDAPVKLVNFWATWCAPCRAEMPDLVELQQTLGDRGLQIVGVSVDQPGREAVVPYLKQQPLNYPIVIDPRGTIGEQYGGVPALPTSLVIGPDGQVRHRIIGRVRPDSLRPKLTALLPAGDQTAMARERP